MEAFGRRPEIIVGRGRELTEHTDYNGFVLPVALTRRYTSRFSTHGPAGDVGGGGLRRAGQFSLDLMSTISPL